MPDRSKIPTQRRASGSSIAPPSRPHVYEFYDNIPGSGGGIAGSNAIKGVVISSSLVYSGNNITSFSILATITNDLGTQTGPWADGTNSLGESLSTNNHYVGTLFNTKLVGEFAVGNTAPSGTPPYFSTSPLIWSSSHDDYAWFGFNNAGGGYYVPAYDFGNIAIGQSVTRQLDFTVDGAGLDPSDARDLALETSASLGGDLFSNRTTSLKISDWVEGGLNLDLGVDYSIHQGFSSNVSVFSQIPEPGTTVPLGLLLGMAALRRSRRCATA